MIREEDLAKESSIMNIDQVIKDYDAAAKGANRK